MDKPEPPNPLAPSVQDALAALQGADCSAELLETLRQRLHSDSPFRAELAQALWTLSLTRIAQASSPRWISLWEELQSAPPVAPTAPTHPVVSSQTSASPPFEASLLEHIRSEPLRFVRPWWRWAACGALAASLVLAASLGWVLQQPHSASPSLTPPFATLLAAQSPAWSFPSPKIPLPTLGNPIPPGRIRLLSGSVSIGFASGAFVVLKGPAEFELLEPQRLFCWEGQIRLRIPPGAEGFCIETPEGVVTDLGTELGVHVRQGETTRVAVFEGKAEASVTVPGQKGVRTELLQARQGAELFAQSGEIRSTSIEGFLDSKDVPLPNLRLPEDYPTQVLASRPALYWRLNRLETNRIPNEIPDAPALQRFGNVELSPDAGGTTSARLAGGALYAERPWILPSEAYALECWFCPEPTAVSALAALTTGPAFDLHFSYLEITTRVPGHSPNPGAIRFLNRRPPGGSGGMNIFGQPRLLAYRWHHLVAQQSRGFMELFVDGESIGSAQAPPGPDATTCAIYFGALRHVFTPTPENPSRPLERPYQGRLAETALYTHLLRPEEIRQHAGLPPR